MSNSGSTLIDAVNAAYPAMAQFYASDWYVAESANEGYLPVAGCAISASGTAGKVDMTAGICSFGNVDTTITAVTAASTTITSLADATNPKWVALEIDTSGVLQFNSGTAAANPEKPTPTGSRVVVAWLYVPANATAVDVLTSSANGKAKIIDARQLKPTAPTHTGWPYIESGCFWTGDALGSTRAASMTAGVCVIAGVRLRVAAVTARTFTASKDTYVDFQDNGDGTALVVYTEATNNAASPALPNSGTVSNTIRNAIIITGASNIASATLTDSSVGALNQGSVYSVLPIASSIPYCVVDSLGNLIYNTSPQPTLIGYRQIVANVTSTSTSPTDVTGLSCNVIIPTGMANRRIKITSFTETMNTTNTTVGTQIINFILVAGGQVQATAYSQPAATASFFNTNTAIYFGSLAPGTTAVKVRMQQTAAGTVLFAGGTGNPGYVAVELL